MRWKNITITARRTFVVIIIYCFFSFKRKTNFTKRYRRLITPSFHVRFVGRPKPPDGVAGEYDGRIPIGGRVRRLQTRRNDRSLWYVFPRHGGVGNVNNWNPFLARKKFDEHLKSVRRAGTSRERLSLLLLFELISDNDNISAVITVDTDGNLTVKKNPCGEEKDDR